MVAQVGLAFVLLAGAGLVLVSFRQLLQVDPGFDVHGVGTAATSVPQSLYPKDTDAISLMDRTLEAIRGVPGVTAAGATSAIPWGDSHSDSVILGRRLPNEAGRVSHLAGAGHRHSGVFRGDAYRDRRGPGIRRARWGFRSGNHHRG